MENLINKNISVWRGDKTPPTEYHLWIKGSNDIYLKENNEWIKLLSEDYNELVYRLDNLKLPPEFTIATKLDILDMLDSVLNLKE